MTHDYSGHTEVIGHNSGLRLKGLIQEQLSLEALEKDLEGQLSVVQKQLHTLSTDTFPKFLEEIGQTKAGTPDGYEVKVEDNLGGSIPKDPALEDKAMEWAEANGGGDLIKRQIVIEFNKGEESWAKKFLADLAKRKKPVRSLLKRAIHHATLKSWASAEMEKGVPVPLKTLGLFEFRQTKIKVPKKET